ncbi:Double-strand break repair protein mus-23 [Aspergillus fumigatus]|nr:Double-strand break repair protein mus-23 [Aspergillus fumigatus]KAH1676583.1 Double-strand break repair protein mus-23 [Aspergillus fumigatus]KAH1691765.1 Double-strand break repair protein mus-23 [Aspergillus fumigatus]KAH1736218.1 Double-strand break repair protein mus-23 [Aspergillus fumigatus]KAH2131268.1 Double-strand break repair protein mus-23 [Aspergillus fumigatus]
MPGISDAETIRILVSTDNHVGYNERDPTRGDDSWKSFHEVMCLAKERDVDMVLLAGDLFHENKPSRKSMYQVMRSIRMNCLGDKPCELEMLSDASENFQGAFNHVNYEDLDINVAIPIFSIHGNHDDPSGEGHLAALDLLQVSGLLNYYGRTPESDNIHIKPVLLQKGRTKLALYGMSNVRDERLFRTFRDGKVKFYQPSIQKNDWFNLMCVHQNHHAYTETGYLPENFLPDFLDLVIWGHEHECLINPRLNPETKFHVMQPGSSVATSLVPGEAVPKHVAILSITGREFKCEPIRLKTVRPFAMREIVLSEEKGAQKLARKENNRTEVTRFLISIVEELIEEAQAEWLEMQDEADDDEEREVPLPLVRLRVEISTPEGGSYDCENPQRFSNRFVGKVANVNDVVQFYRKKKNTTTRKKDDEIDEAAMSQLSTLDTVKVEQLVREFLAAQSLTILPQNSFGDAVAQFIDKDDKHAMEMFVNESLESQVKHLMSLDREGDEMDDEELARSSIQKAMEKYRTQMEEMFSRGVKKRSTRGKKRFKPKPDGWDTEFDGEWEDQPGALIHSDNEVGDPNEEEAAEDGTELQTASSTRGRGRGRGGRAAAATTSRTTAKASAVKKSTSATTTRSRKQQVISDEEDDDVVMLDDDEEDAAPQALSNIEEDEDDDDDSQALFVKQPTTRTRKPASSSVATRPHRSGRSAASPAPSSATISGTATGRTSGRARQRQTTLNFVGSQSSTRSRAAEPSRPASKTSRSTRAASVASEDIDDDSDAFEPMQTSRRRR